jgi:hypothetical protein
MEEISITVDKHSIYILENSDKIKVANYEEIPILFNGYAAHILDSILPIIGILYSLNTPIYKIREIVSYFNPSYKIVPNKLNIIDMNSFKLLMDSGNTPISINNIAKLVKNKFVCENVILDNFDIVRVDHLLQIMHSLLQNFETIYIEKDRINIFFKHKIILDEIIEKEQNRIIFFDNLFVLLNSSKFIQNNPRLLILNSSYFKVFDKIKNLPLNENILDI